MSKPFVRVIARDTQGRVTQILEQDIPEFSDHELNKMMRRSWVSNMLAFCFGRGETVTFEQVERR